MSEAYLGEIRMFAGNYAPRNWALCAGQVINISDNQALFAVIGTFYGGDGRATFKLPDLRGRVGMGFGQGPGLVNIPIGQIGGAQAIALGLSQLPVHTHNATFTPTAGGGGGGGGYTPPTVDVTIAVANNNTSATTNPEGNILGIGSFGGLAKTQVSNFVPATEATGTLGGVNVTVSGGGGGGGGITGGSVDVGTAGQGQAFSILPPFVGVTYIICTEGLFPARN